MSRPGPGPADPTPPGALQPQGSPAAWLQERFPIDWEALRGLSNEPVPNHLRHWWWCLGGTPALLFVLQAVTGILLSFYYKPEWYFFWTFRWLKLTGLTWAVLSIGFVGFLTLIWPFIDAAIRRRRPGSELPSGSERRRCAPSSS